MTNLLRTRTATVLAVLAVLGLAVASLFTPASTDPADARESQVQTHRLAGADRFVTAVQVSRATWADGEPAAVFIANGHRSPDALAAPSLAGTYVGPVLLTEQGSVPQVVFDETDRLAPQDVFLLGGEAAISDDVVAQFEERYGAEHVQRIAGSDRYGTAAEVARTVAGATGIGEIEGRRTAFLADGTAFPDALSVGPASYEARLPVLLTRPDSLPAETESALRELDIEHVVISGGAAAVSAQVADQVQAITGSTERQAGRDRTDTAVQIAEWSLGHVGFDRHQLILARGDGFADSLSAAPRAASLDAPIVLSRSPHELSYDLLQFLTGAGGITEQVIAVGGGAALSDRVLQRAAEAAKQPVRTIAYHTGTRGDVEADFAYFSEHADWTLVDQRGWSLNNDYRFVQVPEVEAEFNLWLSDPEAVAAAAPGCVDTFSCRVGDDIYVNEERWDNGGFGTWSDPALLDEYRHYVVTHEVGHWVGFGHIDCDEYWAAEQEHPMPVMDQQSKSSDQERCGPIRTWPLQADAPQDPWNESDPESEFSRAYDLYDQGESAPGTASTSDADTAEEPDVDVE